MRHVLGAPNPLQVITSVPVLSAPGSYSTGDYVGTTLVPQAFLLAPAALGGAVEIKTLAVDLKTTAAPVAMELWLFNATFTAPTDNAAWDITDAMELTQVGLIAIPSTPYYASSSNQFGVVNNINQIVQCAAASRSLFYALVARGTYTFADGDIQLRLGVRRA